MSAHVYFLPLHPSYFDEPVTQQELDWFERHHKHLCRPTPQMDDLPRLVFIREPGKWTGAKFDDTKISPKRRQLLERARPAMREQMISLAMKLAQEDYEAVRFNILDSIKQARRPVGN